MDSPALTPGPRVRPRPLLHERDLFPEADMSRSYRISVRESVNRVIRAEDRVSTELEILQVLPPEQMSGLLADELQSRGFEREGGQLVRRQDGVTVSVDPDTGTVTVSSE